MREILYKNQLYSYTVPLRTGLPVKLPQGISIAKSDIQTITAYSLKFLNDHIPLQRTYQYLTRTN
jgi:hypothetical protein